MGGGRAATPLGRVTTPAGKASKVDAIREQLENSMLIFSVPSAGLTVSQMSTLRTKLPESSKVMVCKNTLMEKAAADTDWESVGDLLTQENMWFFVGEDGVRDTLDAYGDWVKAVGKTESHGIKGGVMEGKGLDAKAVEATAKLPTKLELIAKIASGINNAGAQGLVTKLANVKGGPKSIAIRLKKASGQKLATAIKLSLGDAEKNPNA